MLWLWYGRLPRMIAWPTFLKVWESLISLPKASRLLSLSGEDEVCCCAVRTDRLLFSDSAHGCHSIVFETNPVSAFVLICSAYIHCQQSESSYTMCCPFDS
jgi:hypothetical protein